MILKTFLSLILFYKKYCYCYILLSICFIRACTSCPNFAFDRSVLLDIYLTCPSAQFWVYYSCFMYPAFIGAWSLFVSQTKNMNQGQSYFIWILWVFTLVNQFLIILKGEIKGVLVSHVTFPFHPCNDNLFKHILPLHCYSAIILCWLWGLARFMSFFFMLKFWWGLLWLYNQVIL